MSWQQIYHSYDDTALELFANAGLLRRAYKDVEANKVRWLDSTTTDELTNSGTLEADGQQVTLTEKGIQNARCTCPASGCCKHILAAVLWLRAQPLCATSTVLADLSAVDVSTETATVVTAEHQFKTATVHNLKPKSDAVENNKPSTVLAQLLALLPKDLFKAAGIAAVRKAYQWFTANQQLNDNALKTSVQLAALQIKITLPSVDTEVIYILGGGFAGMLSDVKPTDQKALHLFALAEVFALYNTTWQWPEALQPAPSNTGKHTTLLVDELNLLHNITQLCDELLLQGLAHVSRSSATQLRMLNLSARAEGLPKLAGYLRTLSGLINLLASRDDHVEVRQALLQMASVFALIVAMQQTSGEKLEALKGRVRRTYLSSINSDLKNSNSTTPAELTLQPLGAQWWQTTGGARGITLCFWETQSQQLLEMTLARPDGNDPSFSKQHVWAQQAVWKQTAQRLCQSPCVLHAPRLSDDGRLAGLGDSYALGLPLFKQDDNAISNMGIDDWQSLFQSLKQQVNFTSQTPAYVLLRFTRFDTPFLDEVRQTLIWTIFDINDTPLHLEIPCHANTQHKLTQLELCCTEHKPMAAVLVQVHTGFQNRYLEPVSILLQGSDNTITVFSLGYDKIIPSKKGIIAPLVARISRMLAEKEQQKQLTIVQPSLASRICEPALDVLIFLASTGRTSLTPYQQQALQTQIDLAKAAGIDIIAKTLMPLLETSNTSNAQLLQASHVLARAMGMG